MNIICTSFREMSERIKAKNSRVAFFGAGVLGQVVAPEIFKNCGVLDNLLCYLDNDSSKWGIDVDVYGKTISVMSVDSLKQFGDNTVIILNISRYAEVIEQLESMDCTKKMDCYLMGMMCVHNFCLKESSGELMLCDEPVIQKKIHYMWLGRKELPDNLKKCIESWKKYCPDYEIIEWNEDNYDLDKHPYMKDAYNAGAYGFVPDYARLDILYEHGGIYMDTDVELKKNLDPLLYQEAFCGVEKWQVLNFGGCSGATKGNRTIKRFLDERKKIMFIDESGKENKLTCGFYDTKVAIDLGYELNGKTQSIEGMNIYASDYFHPYDYMSGSLNVTNNTYSVHWFNGGWLDEESRLANKRTAEKYNDLYKRALSARI